MAASLPALLVAAPLAGGAGEHPPLLLDGGAESQGARTRLWLRATHPGGPDEVEGAAFVLHGPQRVAVLPGPAAPDPHFAKYEALVEASASEVWVGDRFYTRGSADATEVALPRPAPPLDAAGEAPSRGNEHALPGVALIAALALSSGSARWRP